MIPAASLWEHYAAVAAGAAVIALALALVAACLSAIDFEGPQEQPGRSRRA